MLPIDAMFYLTACTAPYTYLNYEGQLSQKKEPAMHRTPLVQVVQQIHNKSTANRTNGVRRNVPSVTRSTNVRVERYKHRRSNCVDNTCNGRRAVAKKKQKKRLCSEFGARFQREVQFDWEITEFA